MDGVFRSFPQGGVTCIPVLTVKYLKGVAHSDKLSADSAAPSSSIAVTNSLAHNIAVLLPFHSYHSIIFCHSRKLFSANSLK